MIELPTLLAYDIKDNELRDVDKNFVCNVWKISERFNRHINSRAYADESFYAMVFQLTQLLTFKNTVYDVKPFIKPYELANMNEDQLAEVSQIERTFAGLFVLFPEFKNLFELDPEEFRPRQMSFELHQRLITEHFEEIELFSFPDELPTSSEKLIETLEKQLPNIGHLMDVLGIEVLKYISSDDNPEYKGHFYQNFITIFEDINKIEENEYWLHTYPRKSDASFSGYLDMALHSWINNSYVLHEMIEHYKKKLNS